MPAVVISVANQKGGVGKTNTAVHLSGTLVRRNFRVLLVDADPQATATRWVSGGDGESMITVANLSTAGGSLHREIKKFIEIYDYIVVDCPPSCDSPITQSMMLVSDLVIVPVIPNPGDGWATVSLLELADRMKAINESLKVVLVASNVRPNVSMSVDMIAMLEIKCPDSPFIETRLHQRSAYPASMLKGDSCHALGRTAKAAIAEMEAFTDNVLGAIHGC